MGGNLQAKGSSGRSKGRRSLSPSRSSCSDSESDDRKRSRRVRDKRHTSGGSKRSRKEKEGRSSSSSSKRKSSRRDEEDRERRKKRRKHKRRSRRERSESSTSSLSGSSSSSLDRDEKPEEKPVVVLRGILQDFPDVAADLIQLLQMVDSGQAVDIRGIPDRTLMKLLKGLFHSLNLTRDDGVFLLPPGSPPTMDLVGPLIQSHAKSVNTAHNDFSDSKQSLPPGGESKIEKDENHAPKLREPQGSTETSAPQRRRFVGPEMPSTELLAAAAELTKAEAALRDADFEEDDDLFIGPAPPAVAAEAESANEAERFEEVTRIMEAETDKPYDVLGVNHNLSFENIKKRYWKLSLMVHPDKCSHPQAQQAFVILNQALKDLQDPDKRKAIDEKIKLKEEQEAFKAELKSLREAAQWRKLQGISLEGDDVLLAEPELPQQRDEWMTKLPPERKPGVTMQSTSFSRTGKEGRGDTSMWTDSPLDKIQKAKLSYLEAHDKATALAAADDEKKKMDSAGNLVDRYNLSKRSKSLVQKHQEELSRPKKKSKDSKPVQEDWVGDHPWKPWDREKDLVAGRQKVKLDSENMAQGLSSRFSSGSVQRSFL